MQQQLSNDGSRRKRRAVSFNFLERGLPTRQFRPELHGVRGLAILGVVLFHLFGAGRVSGGIDIFLAISGFLFTGMLLREAAGSHGRINFSKYFSRLVRRILIPAAIVVLVTLALGLWIKPATDHHQLWAEARASILYFENIELINSQLAYGAAGPETSPFQHYWSLSVQGQFYLSWPVVAIAAVLLAKYLHRPAATVMTIMVSLLLIASLVYAVYYGSYSQQEAYLMSQTRAWELAFGGLLALVGLRLALPRQLKIPLGWLGLGLIVSCGFVIDGAQEFPGLLAFWPLGGLFLVLLAAGSGGGAKDPVGSATRFLSNPIFGWIGDRAYGIYLWHWPLLIYYMEIRQEEAISLAGAAFILLLTLILAELMYRFIEQPIMQRKVFTLDSRVFISGAAALALAGIGMTAGAQATLPPQESVSFDDEDWDWDKFPGAKAAHEGNSDLDGSEEFLPDVAALANQRPKYYAKGCRQDPKNAPGTDQVKVCEDENKPSNPSHTVVLAGGSHAGQWEAAWVRMGQEYGWEILIADKSGCVFADWSDDPERSSCQGWNENFMTWIEERGVDLVVTPGTRMSGGVEKIMPGAQQRWEQITATGTKLLLPRGTPRPGGKQGVARCLEKGGDAYSCGAKASQISAVNPLTKVQLPEGASTFDMTDDICPSVIRKDGICPAIVGNVAVWYDNSHLTSTYIETMLPRFEAEVRKAEPFLFED